MKRRVGLIPGTYAYTYAASRAKLVADTLFGAFHHIIGPFFIALVDYLFAKTDRSRGTIPGTLFAFTAEVLKPEINGSVYGKR